MEITSDSVKKKIVPGLVLSVLFLLASCSRVIEATPEITQTPLASLFEVTYCDINPSDMCLEGFGTDDENRLLILFKADDRFFADIYIRAEGPEGEVLFECQQSEHSLESIYCLGEPLPENESIKLNIYSKSNDSLIAVGVFNVEYSDFPAPDVVFGITPTPSPIPEANATPTPSPEPSYPNPSYPNPTSAP